MTPARISKDPGFTGRFGDLCVSIRVSKPIPWTQEKLAEQVDLRYGNCFSSILKAIKRLEAGQNITMNNFDRIMSTLLGEDLSVIFDAFHKQQQGQNPSRPEETNVEAPHHAG